MTHRVWLVSPAVLLLLFAAALTGRNAVRLIRGRRDLASSLETFTNQVLAFATAVTAVMWLLVVKVFGL